MTVLELPGVRQAPRRAPAQTAARSPVQLAAFAGLGLYGALRWGTMLHPEPVARLLGLVALALAVAALAGTPLARRPWPALLVVLAALVAVLPISGIQLSWIVHVRIAVTVDAIGEGLSALPGLLVPYNGINDSVREVIVAGAGLLLVSGGAVLAFAPRSLGEVRGAAAALPLVVLAVVPAALARPAVPYLHGVILFVLVAGLVWGDRTRQANAFAITGVLCLSAAGAMLAAPALDPHSPWLDFQTLAGSLGPGHGESFDWSQRYGPLKWPRTGREVLDVQAAIPDYWKAQNLDVFDGRGWTTAAGADGDPYAGVDQAALDRWTQTIQVTLRGMSTNVVVAAGTASEPRHLPGVLLPGASGGTWLSAATIGPGDSYRVRVYTPHPSPGQLAGAGEDLHAAPLTNYLSLMLPPFSVVDRGVLYQVAAQPVTFAPFGSPDSQPVDTVNNQPAGQLLAASPYAQVFALARRLAVRAPNPYAYVTNVLSYLAHGYRYDENPPQSRYPLVTFLLHSRSGYCQQFAGAMALLLRMGGVPARVSAGFTTGRYDGARKQFVVADIDAHAWVEAWFPHYGWVRFDPTPGAAPARGGHVPLPSLSSSGAAKPAPARPVRPPDAAPAASRAGNVAHPQGTSSSLWILLVAIAVALLALAALARIARARRADRLFELERAFARCGRPLPDGVTLAALEHRFRFSPKAAAYVRGLRLERFAGGAPEPTFDQRRAVREQLAAGGGPIGRLRALWALPPLPRLRTRLGNRQPGS